MSNELRGFPGPSEKTAVILTLATGLAIAAAVFLNKKNNAHGDIQNTKNCRTCEKSQSRGYTIRGNGR